MQRIIAFTLGIKLLLFLMAGQAWEAWNNQHLVGVHAWLALWNRWDAINLGKLAQHGYSGSGENAPFLVLLPLHPWLVRIVAFFTDDYLVSALLISCVAGAVLAVLLWRLVRLDYSSTTADLAVGFLFIFPTSYVLHIGYTESLFLALVIGSLLMAREERWLLAGLLGALACLTRVQGIIILPALMAEAGQQWYETRRWEWQRLFLGFAGLGILGYLWLNYHVTGHPLAFMGIQQTHFYRGLDWPWAGARSAVGATARADGEMTGMQEITFLCIGLAGTVWAWVKLRPSYAVWMSGVWLLSICTGLVICVPRYTLMMFPLFILLGMTRGLWAGMIAVWSVLYLAVFSAIFSSGRWAF